MRTFAVGESICEEADNEENSSGTSDKMQKTEKPKKMDGSDTSNRNDLNEVVTKGRCIRSANRSYAKFHSFVVHSAADVNVDKNTTPITPISPATPAQHPRIWSIKNNGRQANKSPKTPLSSNASGGGEKTPITGEYRQ